jgi:hypothetical protein
MKALLLMLFLLLPGAATAAEMTPLRDYLARPAGEVEATYPLARCAGLQLFLMRTVPRERESALFQQFQRQYESLFQSAVIIRSNLTQNPPALEGEAVQNMVVVISKLYSDRENADYTTAGEFFHTDPLISDDLALCKEVLEKNHDATRVLPID